jgi:hypothetical protein
MTGVEVLVSAALGLGCLAIGFTAGARVHNSPAARDAIRAAERERIAKSFEAKLDDPENFGGHWLPLAALHVRQLGKGNQ